MESHVFPGTIQVTERTYERLRERYELRAPGTIEVKGKGPMTTCLLEGRHGDRGIVRPGTMPDLRVTRADRSSVPGTSRA